MTYDSHMFFIAYAFKGQGHVFPGQVKIVSHLSSRTSAVLKYFCPLVYISNIFTSKNDSSVPDSPKA